MASEGAKYAPWLIVYAVTVLILFSIAYYLISYKKIKIPCGHESVLIFGLLCLGLLLRLACATLMDGHPFDISLFKSWATTAANNLNQVYAGGRSSDYPPLYMYVLALIGKIAGVQALNPYFTPLLKLPSIIADIATAYLIYRSAVKYLSPETSALAAAFYAFNPAVVINSTFWGQVDSFFTLIVVSAVALLAEKKAGLSAVLFTAAVMMKPQGIIFLPVLFFDLVRQKSWKLFLQAAAFALATVVIMILPFSLHNNYLWIIDLFSNTMAEYPYASVNAFNFFSLIGKNYINDATIMFISSYHTWGMFFIVFTTFFSWFVYSRKNNSKFAPAVALVLIAGVFTFSTRMHERYLFPAVALAILAYIYFKDKRLLLLAAGFSATVYTNTHAVLFHTGGGMKSLTYSPALFFTSLLNVLLFVYLAKVVYELAVKKEAGPPEVVKT